MMRGYDTLERDLWQRFETGFGEEVTLEQGHAERTQCSKLGRGLHTFRDHLDRQGPADANDAIDDGVPTGVRIEATQQRHVDFHQVGLEMRKQAEPAEATAEIVEGGAETVSPVDVEDAFEMGVVGDLLVLGELEHEPVGRNWCRRAAARVARTQFSGRYIAPGMKLIDRLAPVCCTPRRLANAMAFTRQDWSKA